MKSYLRLTIDLEAGADFNGNPAIRSNTMGDDAWDRAAFKAAKARENEK